MACSGWTPEQCATILDAIWREVAVLCPNDGALLSVSLRKLIGGDYTASAHCPQCGAQGDLKRSDDPLQGSFRLWTDEEKQAMAIALLADGRSRCPSDGTPVIATASAMGKDQITILVSCFRCQQAHSETFRRDTGGGAASLESP